MKKICIAIDGPAGAGKSTIAKLVSKSLNIMYLDTGAMYRAVALSVLEQKIDIKDQKAVSKVLDNINLEVKYCNGEQKIFVNNNNVTSLIRTPQMSVAASDIAVLKEVRIKMVDIQREIAKKNSIIMDGRDIGSYVLPDAEVKIFLTARVEVRANRRYNDLVSMGIFDKSIEDVIKDIEYRDKNDSERNFAPLIRAKDAHLIDTTNMSIDDVVKKIIFIVEGIW